MKKYVIIGFIICLTLTVFAGCGQKEEEEAPAAIMQEDTEATVDEQENPDALPEEREQDEDIADSAASAEIHTTTFPTAGQSGKTANNGSALISDRGEQDGIPVPPTVTAENESALPYVNYIRTGYNAAVIDICNGTVKYNIYQVDIATDEAFTRLVLSDMYDFGMMTLTGLEPDTQYYLRTRGVRDNEYSGFSKTYAIKTEPLYVDSVSITNAQQLDIFVGDEYALDTVVLPAEATDKSLTWSSTDDTVATVSAEGVITAVGTGNAAIIACSSNGERASCAVHVGNRLFSSRTDKLVLDKSTLSNNAIFGRYNNPATGNSSVEQGVDFDGTYLLRSFEAWNSLIGSSYFFGGVYRNVNVDGIPFSYTWTEESAFDFDGNDCIIVNNENSSRTLGFTGAGAYERIYLLSLAEDKLWDADLKRWYLGTDDIYAEVTVSYEDGSTDTETVNFCNAMRKNSSLPSYDAYTLSSITARIDSVLGSAGDAPYMYAIAVTCDPQKQLDAVTVTLKGQNDKRLVYLAVFAVSGQISNSAPEAVAEKDITVTDRSEYGFTLSWDEKADAEGYYFGIFEDEGCTTPCYVSIGSRNIYLSREKLYIGKFGFSNAQYAPGKTYYVKITAFNQYGSSKATVFPVVTTGTYPREIRLSQRSASLAIGESLTLTVSFPSNDYYTYSAIEWSVSNPDILRVKDGKLTPLVAGEATVRAALAQYPEIYAECTVTVSSYEEGWIGYDDGVFLSDETCFTVGGNKDFYAEMSCSAIRISSAQTGEANLLDMFSYYVSAQEETEYLIYLLEQGETPLGKEPVARGTVPVSAMGWTTITLAEPVEMSGNKDIWIVIDSNFISRSDNESVNGSLGKIECRWTDYSSIGIPGTLMVRAHFTEE